MAKKRLDQAKARLQMAQARESTAARKKETRGKILVGGYLVAAARNGDQAAISMIEAAIAAAARKDDRDVLKGLLGKGPASPTQTPA